MKGSSVYPGGSLVSKPTWSNPKGIRSRRLFLSNQVARGERVIDMWPLKIEWGVSNPAKGGAAADPRGRDDRATSIANGLAGSGAGKGGAHCDLTVGQMLRLIVQEYLH